MFTDHFLTKFKGCTVSYEPIPPPPTVYGPSYEAGGP